MESLSRGLAAATQVLGPSGRLVVISYHSVEDRVVKGYLTRESSQCICSPPVIVCICEHQATLRLVQRRVVKPSPGEVEDNSRSRSAKMRVASRL